MPRVPKSKRQVFEGVTAVRSNVEAPAEAFGGGRVVDIERRGINNVARAAKDIAKTMDDFDKTEVKRARRELQEFADDQSARFNLLKNKDPSIQRQQYDDEYEKKYQELTKGLGNDNQRTLFFDVKDQLDVGRKRVLGRHQLSEAHNYQNDEDMATLASEADIAANNYEDRSVIANSLNSQAQVYLDYAARNGLANKDEKTGKITLTEEGKQGLKKELSKTHLGVISRAINEGHDTKAKEYFDSIKDGPELDGDTKDKMLRLVEGASQLGEAQRFADKVVADNLDKTTALAEARKTYEGEQEALAIREIKNRFAEKEDATREYEKQVFRVHMDSLDKAKGKYTPKDTEYLTMTPEKRQAFDRRKAMLLAGKEPTTNWAKYSDLRTMATNPATRDKFLQLDPMMYRNDLADAEFKEIVKLAGSIKNKDDKFVNNFFSVGKQLEASYKEAGIKFNPKIQSHKERKGRFEKFVGDKVLEKQEELKRKLSDVEIQEVIDQALIKGKIEDGGWLWFDKDARLFEVPASEMQDFQVEGFNTSEFIRAQNWLRKNKKPHAQEDVIEVLKQMK